MFMILDEQFACFLFFDNDFNQRGGRNVVLIDQIIFISSGLNTNISDLSTYHVSITNSL